MATINRQSGDGRGGTNICPTCNQPINLKPIGDSLLSFDTDGTIHHCWPAEPKAIGPAVKGKTIQNFSLKKRRVTLTLSDGMTLEIYASLNNELVTMNMTLVSPEGIREEKK
ncbi:MAG: hypothetical protein MUP81_06455 [Dehalococcoidia bacterium]|nr:hypothetical protein [Dehalococcoidia bacterium]